MSKSNRITLGVIVLCVVSFLCYFSYNSWNFHTSFYKRTISNLIEDVRQDSQGSFEIKLDSTWVFFGMNGASINTIQKGDSIIKSSNSYQLMIKRKSENYKSYIYDWSKY
jgi:hypothetical protein